MHFKIAYNNPQNSNSVQDISYNVISVVSFKSNHEDANFTTSKCWSLGLCIKTSKGKSIKIYVMIESWRSAAAKFALLFVSQWIIGQLWSALK
jgi:type III secretory pathway lipoprotein EscJ